MRVYEFSKQCGIPARELIDLLGQAGFEVNSHMSVLSPQELDFLQKKYSRVQKQEAPAKSVEQKAAPSKVTTTAEPVTEKPKETVSNAGQPEKPGARVEAALKIKTISPEPEATAQVPPLVLRPMNVGQLAEELKQPVTAIILTLLKWGIVAPKNQLLAEDLIVRLAQHYEIPVIKSEKKEKVELRQQVVQGAGAQERLPVVVVVGHVDHGKTTLLDFIRKTRVAAREKGGITQHLGAYEASSPHGNIVFIDTPGHEAFSKMRMRGVKVADIVILVVAADDGVMPQTVEAIKHAKSMEVPIIVAINKVDKVDPSRIEQVKQELSRHDLLAEEWGGTVVVAPISAKTGVGIDHLLEMIILQSQLMELKTDIKGPAKGYVLESKLEKGRGPVATFLSQQGTLRVGDYFTCGATVGRVSSLIDSHGARVENAGPSIPVRVAGFSELPEAGDYFEVVSREEYLKVRSTGVAKIPPAARHFAHEGVINLVVKTDSNSSKEALLGSIQKLSKNFEKQFNIVYASIGDISESDIALAATTGSRIVGLHIKPGPNALNMAQKHDVSIELFDIIYKLLEHLEAVAEGAKEIKMVKEKIGEAVVRRVFDIKGLGVIAGCYVTDGRFSKDGSVVIFRNQRKIGEGDIKSLQREKKPVKEVHAGYECGFIVDGVTDIMVDDRIECFIEVPEKKK